MKDWKGIFKRNQTVNLKKLIPIETYVAETVPYRLFYRVAGPADGPKLVLMHGLALSTAYLQPLIRMLAAYGYRVYAPDFPGTGRSDKAPGNLSVDQISHILSDWLRAVNLTGNGQKVHLAAHSAGGQPAINIALENPDWIETLSLISVTGGKGVRSWIPLVLSIGLDAFYELNPLVFIALYRYFHTGVIESLQTAYQHCKEDVKSKATGLGSFPTLILWAGRDVVTSLKFGRELNQLIANSRLVILPRATHGLAYSQYRTVAGALHQFLAESCQPVPLIYAEPMAVSAPALIEQVVG